MNSKIIAAVAVAFLMATMFAAVPSDPTDAEPTFEITDGLGTKFILDGPAEHIITVGAGVTATVIGVDAIDKIVVCDSYSKTNSADLFDELRERIDNGSIAANGNLYGGKDALKIDIVSAADTEKGGLFDKDRDVVIVTGSDTYRANIVPFLEEKGFKYVLQWYDISEYSDIIDFAKSISMICNGSVHESVRTMEGLSDHIAEILDENEHDVRDAFYVTYSGNAFKVGNVGSLANSMIAAAGGNAFTTDPDKAKPTYETNVTKIIEGHPDAVVFVDNTIASNPTHLSSLQSQVGDDVMLVPLKAIWNNYCIESMDGVWTMACAMYPELFHGDIPELDGEDTNIMLYAGIAVAVVAVIGVGAFVFMKR